jgi:hypothetical protein
MFGVWRALSRRRRRAVYAVRRAALPADWHALLPVFECVSLCVLFVEDVTHAVYHCALSLVPDAGITLMTDTRLANGARTLINGSCCCGT